MRNRFAQREDYCFPVDLLHGVRAGDEWRKLQHFHVEKSWKDLYDTKSSILLNSTLSAREKWNKAYSEKGNETGRDRKFGFGILERRAKEKRSGNTQNHFIECILSSN